MSLARFSQVDTKAYTLERAAVLCLRHASELCSVEEHKRASKALLDIINKIEHFANADVTLLTVSVSNTLTLILLALLAVDAAARDRWATPKRRDSLRTLGNALQELQSSAAECKIRRWTPSNRVPISVEVILQRIHAAAADALYQFGIRNEFSSLPDLKTVEHILEVERSRVLNHHYRQDNFGDGSDTRDSTPGGILAFLTPIASIITALTKTVEIFADSRLIHLPEVTEEARRMTIQAFFTHTQTGTDGDATGPDDQVWDTLLSVVQGIEQAVEEFRVLWTRDSTFRQIRPQLIKVDQYRMKLKSASTALKELPEDVDIPQAWDDVVHFIENGGYNDQRRFGDGRDDIIPGHPEQTAKYEDVLNITTPGISDDFIHGHSTKFPSDQGSSPLLTGSHPIFASGACFKNVVIAGGDIHIIKIGSPNSGWRQEYTSFAARA